LKCNCRQSTACKSQHATDGISSTGVKSCLPIPGSLHCSMTDKTQHASHSMQQIGISSTAASSSLYSIAVTWREWSSQHHIAVKSCLQIPGPLHCRVTDTAQLASTACSRCAQAALQHHQHCVALLSHTENGSSQHHTAVNSCLQIPAPLHCSVTDRAQHASHSMQQKGISSTATSSALHSTAVT